MLPLLAELSIMPKKLYEQVLLLTRFFERKSQAKGRKKAIVATSRKMLEVIYHILKRGEAYHAH